MVEETGLDFRQSLPVKMSSFMNPVLPEGYRLYVEILLPASMHVGDSRWDEWSDLRFS
jgi:hypothetical protein